MTDDGWRLLLLHFGLEGGGRGRRGDVRPIGRLLCCLPTDWTRGRRKSGTTTRKKNTKKRKRRRRKCGWGEKGENAKGREVNAGWHQRTLRVRVFLLSHSI